MIHSSFVATELLTFFWHLIIDDILLEFSLLYSLCQSRENEFSSVILESWPFVAYYMCSIERLFACSSVVLHIECLLVRI